MISPNGLLLQYLPPEVMMKTLFPYLNAVDLMNLSKTNLWWKEKVKIYLVDFVLSSVEVLNSKTPVIREEFKKVLNSLENLDTDFIIDDIFPLLKFYHLKLFQKVSVFWNRKVKFFIEKLKINPENRSSYWQERETEDMDVLMYLNSKHFERLTLNLHLQSQVQVMGRRFGKYDGSSCIFWQVNVRGGKIILTTTRDMNRSQTPRFGSQGLRPHSGKPKRATGIVDIDDREVLNY